MIGGYWTILSAHTVAVLLSLKLLGYLLPLAVIHAFSSSINILLTLLTVYVTFSFTKKRYLNQRVRPTNKAVFITGTDTGFGNALARRLDRIGFHVFASALHPQSSEAQDLKNSCSDKLHLLPMDVTSDESVKSAAEYVKDHLGKCELHALVNNAGVYRGFSIELSSMADFKTCLEVNSMGPVRVTKAFLPLLRKNRGRIVNVTSMCGRMPSPHSTPYVMSKYAEIAFNDCLRQEMNDWGIKVISIEPELFKTGLILKNLNTNLDSSLATVDEDVKAAYGATYLNQYRSYANAHFNRGSPKLELVIDDLVTAISLKHPDIVYCPRRNILISIAVFFYTSLMPLKMKDIAAYTVGYISRVPVPNRK